MKLTIRPVDTDQPDQGYRVELDGNDISEACNRVDLTAEAGRAPEVVLYLDPYVIGVDLEVEPRKVEVPGDLATVLRVLGWRGPGEGQARR